MRGRIYLVNASNLREEVLHNVFPVIIDTVRSAFVIVLPIP